MMAKRNDYSWHQRRKQAYNLECAMEVWTEGYNFEDSTRHEWLVETERRGFCFFWQFRPGMLIPAAKLLQQREAEAKDARRDRRLTIWGLWIAAAALMIDALLRFWARFWPSSSGV